MDLYGNAARARRCAIYTRKSARPPLDQEITSLESQRAICSAYIASQQHKGWVELSKGYDDAGRSGASLVRPAMQELVTDIELGLVDIVLVYKLDRITRTLLDFVRLIDFFDKYDVVFVAITQNFDTSDSMGRLIRNILLTFAQFEREIASDRMRDKKMVMRQRGLWAGGDPPLGYDLKGGKLVVHRGEEAAIRCIFETYIETGSISAVHHRLGSDGHRRKIRRTCAGLKIGGGPISRTSLHHILRNPVYVGDVSYREERYPGIHQPILDRSTWAQAQAILDQRKGGRPNRAEHILRGLVFDPYGRRMNGRFEGRLKANCRNYVSAVVKWGVQEKLRVSRVRAEQLEQLVIASLSQLMSDRRRLRRMLADMGFVAPQLDQLCNVGCAGAARLARLDHRRIPQVLKTLIYRIDILADCVRVTIRSASVAKFLVWDGIGTFVAEGVELVRATRLQVIDIPVSVDRQRRRLCIPVEQRTMPGAPPSADLLMLLEDARLAQELMFKHRDVSIAQMAWSLGRRPASFARLIRLNYLAPDIVAAIIDGNQPADLTRAKLAGCDLPVDWELQRQMLGFPPRRRDAAGSSGLFPQSASVRQDEQEVVRS
jgi:site-specific DNA recombinase